MKSLATWSVAIALTVAASLPAAAQSKTELRFFTNFDAARVKLWDPILAQFHQEHPDVQVKLETVAGSGAAIYPDVLRTSMAAGDPPDVFFMWGGEISGPFVDAGQVLELSPYYAKYGWKDRFPEWTIERVTRKGGIYGVPYNARGMAFWYRKDLFEKHGIEVPKSYTELEGVCTTLKENGVHCATFGGKFGWHPMRLLDYFLETTCGPEVHKQLNTLTASWNQPCVVDAYVRLQKWVQNGWLVPDFLNVSPSDARMPLYIGSAAMIIEGDNFEVVARGDGITAENLDFFVGPTGHEPLRFHGYPEQWMIPVGSDHQDTAAMFIDWITKAEVQKKHTAAFTSTATKGVQPDCSTLPHSCAWREVITGDAETFPPTDQAFTKELIDGFFEIQDGIIAGRITPEAGAAMMDERAKAWKAAKG
jgi:raffinose/stachyose/melibiose transport system substrate-binding protein